jgi:hypothetical protein
MMAIAGYADYKKREFCNDVKCSVQAELNSRKEGSDGYEKLRETCSSGCKFTAWQFHHWLIEHGYSIVKSEKVK